MFPDGARWEWFDATYLELWFEKRHHGGSGEVSGSTSRAEDCMSYGQKVCFTHMQTLSRAVIITTEDLKPLLYALELCINGLINWLQQRASGFEWDFWIDCESWTDAEAKPLEDHSCGLRGEIAISTVKLPTWESPTENMIFYTSGETNVRIM